MSARLSGCFARLQKRGHMAYIPYLMAGDPGVQETLTLMHQFALHGADILELGVPFSDPAADGPVLQEAGQRALAASVTLETVMGLCRSFRRDDTTTPLVLMSYANPLFRFGYRACAEALAEAGVDGLIVVDMPPEEPEPLVGLLEARDIAMIRLVSPNTPATRVRHIAAGARGFLYAVSIAGTTGSASAGQEAQIRRLATLKDATSLPLVAGFGINTPDQARALHGHAHGVITGSALVRCMQEASQAGDDPLASAVDFVTEMALALHPATSEATEKDA